MRRLIRSLARIVGEGMREAVQQARQAGHTWAEIGDLLGTTRHAGLFFLNVAADRNQ